MSEDQNRDPDGRGPDVDGLFSERPGGASGRSDAEDQDKAAKSGPELPTPPPPLDEEAVAKHRAAKQARIRKRREEMRRQQAAAQGISVDEVAAEGKQGARPGGAGAAAQEGADGAAKRRGSALPALRPDIKPDTPALRAERVEAIRRDLVRRRRRKGGGMLLKLWMFVLMPTLAVAWFLWFEASNLYKSESSFMVRSAAEGASSGGGLLGAFMGGGGASAIFDPVAVQTYITSRDVLERLDAEHGWIAHFQDPDLDFWHRLPADVTFEDAFAHYERMVSVSYDPTEGIIEMEMIASDSDAARDFSRAIIGYAEESVDNLSDRIQRDAVSSAQSYHDEAKRELSGAQIAMAEAQKRSEIFSVEGEVSAQMSLISGLEVQREELKTKLANLRRVTTEADPRVQRTVNEIETLTSQIDALRGKIAGNSTDEKMTLADINTDIAVARLNVETAMVKWTSALERLEIARENAAQQQRYLELVAQPSLPDTANYPKKPEMTALAFLAFLGFYIVGSLTLSLIREQASI